MEIIFTRIKINNVTLHIFHHIRNLVISYLSRLFLIGLWKYNCWYLIFNVVLVQICGVLYRLQIFWNVLTKYLAKKMQLVFIKLICISPVCTELRDFSLNGMRFTGWLILEGNSSCIIRIRLHIPFLPWLLCKEIASIHIPSNNFNMCQILFIVQFLNKNLPNLMLIFKPNTFLKEKCLLDKFSKFKFKNLYVIGEFILCAESLSHCCFRKSLFIYIYSTCVTEARFNTRWQIIIAVIRNSL